MNSLPNDQVPRLHTPGEKFRDRQLIIQIPKQDMAEEFCRHLGDATAVENFNQFLELREEAAFGVGRVKEYLPQDTVSLPVPGTKLFRGRSGPVWQKSRSQTCE